MKFLVTVLISALVIGSFATSDEEAYKTLQRMEETKFGRTLLDTIAIQLSASDQVEDLIALLQEMEHRLQEEQKSDDVGIVQFQHECDEILAKLEYEIQEAEERIKVLQEELDEKIPVRDQKTKERKEKQEFADMLVDAISELDHRKELKDQEWVEIQQEHDSNTFILEKAKQVLISALQSGFLQKDSKTVFAQVSEHFKQSSKLKQKRRTWTGLFQVLASITANAPVQANQGLVKEVIDLCDELLSKIAESKEIERRSYEHWVEEYVEDRSQYNNKLDKVNGEIFNLDTELAGLNKRINNATTERNEQQERKKQKQIQHDDHLKQCEDENKAYSVRRADRQSNQGVMSDAIGLLQQNLRLFRKYVADRLKGIKKSA